MRWPYLFMASMFFGNAFNWFAVDEYWRGLFGVVLGSGCVLASDYWRENTLIAGKKGRISP